MKHFLFLSFLFPLLLKGQEYQLAPPKIYADSVFFLQNARVTMAFDLEDASIHFTTDGSLPLRNSPQYEKPFSLSASATVQAISSHADYVLSKKASIQLVKADYVPDSIRLLTKPDSSYRATPGVLCDLQKGSRDLRDGRWLGFRGDTVVMEMVFANPVQCRQILISTASDPGAWVFPPRRIEVYSLTKGGKWQMLGDWVSRKETNWKNQASNYGFYQEVGLKQTEAQRIRIKVIPFGNLPANHPGAGAPAWLFLDEILFQ